jgi:4-hydroxy-tetrahydrodipicolinate synthase
MITGKHVLRLSGYAPALPTPFDQDGNVNRAALEAVCERQIQEGATALVVCGTTGEAPTLTRAEHYAIICIAVGVAQGRVPVIAGAGSNSTGQTIELARDAEAAGADAVLSVVPYYNKPMQAGMYAHFHAIADAIGLPIILHDVPSRTLCGLADDTVAHLAVCPKFILERRDRRRQASAPLAVTIGAGISIAIGRRRHRIGLHRARRQWLHFGHA